MIDAGEAWHELGRRLLAAPPPPRVAEAARDWPVPMVFSGRAAAGVAALTRGTARLGQIRMRERDEEHGDLFELADMDPQAAKGWAFVVAVRTGHAEKALEELQGTTALAPWLKACEAYPGLEAQMESKGGPEIVDLAAFSLDFSKFHGRYNGHATALGYPFASWQAAYQTRPIRLFRDARGWYAAGCAGAVLIGPAWENEDYLRSCEAGIVTDDVRHGNAVKKILVRPYTGPKVLVAA